MICICDLTKDLTSLPEAILPIFHLLIGLTVRNELACAQWLEFSILPKIVQTMTAKVRFEQPVI